MPLHREFETSNHHLAVAQDSESNIRKIPGRSLVIEIARNHLQPCRPVSERPATPIAKLASPQTPTKVAAATNSNDNCSAPETVATSIKSGGEDPLFQKQFYWYGKEEPEHVRGLMQMYARFLKLEKNRAKNSREPHKFVGKVKRHQISADLAERVLQNSNVKINPKMMITVDEISIFCRLFLQIGSTMPMADSHLVVTQWGTDGVPASFYTLKDKKIIQTIQKLNQTSVSYLYCLPQFSRDSEYQFSASKEEAVVGYSDQYNGLLGKLLAAGQMKAPTPRSLPKRHLSPTDQHQEMNTVNSFNVSSEQFKSFDERQEQFDQEDQYISQCTQDEEEEEEDDSDEDEDNDEDESSCKFDQSIEFEYFKTLSSPLPHDKIYFEFTTSSTKKKKPTIVDEDEEDAEEDEDEEQENSDDEEEEEEDEDGEEDGDEEEEDADDEDTRKRLKNLSLDSKHQETTTYEFEIEFDYDEGDSFSEDWYE